MATTTLRNIHHHPSQADSKPFIETDKQPYGCKGLYLYEIRKDLVYIVNTSGYIIGINSGLNGARERVVNSCFNWEYINHRIDLFAKTYENQKVKIIDVTKELLEEVEE